MTTTTQDSLPTARSKPSRVVATGGFAGTRKSAFPAFRPPGYFSPDADGAAIRAFYAANGYLVMESAFDPAALAELKDETTLICRGERGALEGTRPPAPGVTDDEVLRSFLCIHFPHKICAPMRATLFNPATVKVLTAVIGPNVKCMQSMLFIKPSGKPGQAWHQDEDYILTRDRSLIGAWIALDRATEQNGCLWVIPGSHQPGILWEQRWHGDRRFDCAEEATGFPYGDADAVPVEVEAGAVVFFNGYLLHRSLPNRAPAGAYRRALVNHFSSCETTLPWQRPAENESVAKADYRDIVVVAGSDPYAHRGLRDIAKPFVRPSGEGGCVDWTKKNLEYGDQASPDGDDG